MPMESDYDPRTYDVYDPSHGVPAPMNPVIDVPRLAPIVTDTTFAARGKWRVIAPLNMSERNKGGWTGARILGSGKYSRFYASDTRPTVDFGTFSCIDTAEMTEVVVRLSGSVNPRICTPFIFGCDTWDAVAQTPTAEMCDAVIRYAPFIARHSGAYQRILYSAFRVMPDTQSKTDLHIRRRH